VNKNKFRSFKMKKIVLSAVAVFAMSSFAVAGGDIAPVDVPVVDVPVVDADAGFYLGLAYGLVNGEINDAATDEFASQTLGVVAGYKINSYVAVEARYQMQVTDPKWTDVATDVENDDVDGETAVMSIFVKPMYPVTNELDVYALLGYASTTYTAADTDNTIGALALDDEIVAAGFAYGVGIAYDVTDSVAVFVDYVSLYNADAAEHTIAATGAMTERDAVISSINAGVTYKF
jgi:opacity protein-like surface antigen